jgi:hypothetical protein
LVCVGVTGVGFVVANVLDSVSEAGLKEVATPSIRTANAKFSAWGRSGVFGVEVAADDSCCGTSRGSGEGAVEGADAATGSAERLGSDSFATGATEEVGAVDSVALGDDWLACVLADARF